MKQVLGTKYSMTPESEKIWWDVINNIEEYVSLTEVERATDIARARILKMTEGKKAAYSWSGGKDSLAIAELCQSVGVYKCQCFFHIIPILVNGLFKFNANNFCVTFLKMTLTF